ncbi:uncharacterized protein LOC110972529 isoform X2 [Acanthochromis polyacanthus]|uniref:uncharacterized protein LOC110972529 isoform X2 n=1 Tax=Acanthochromis polyacanthus TaxID=80966 RepID=UPI000B8F3D40|nr:uncharacterized protein LOC110972529 isoform X2 [Acanthochromis polyacanthus]
MLSPATVSAAAAAVWLLAMLGPGLSLPAEDNSEPDFSLCSDCFYRQKPPQGASAGSLLRPVCHRLSGGQAFATLSRPACDIAVYSAFHLSHGWAEGEGEEGEELVTEKEEDFIKVPSLLRRGGDPSHPVSPTDIPLQHWDSTVTTLVQSSIAPQCTTLGGRLFILTGAGGFGAAEDGNKECQMNPLWFAVCCSVPEGKGNFIVGLISETGKGERQVSVKELEEMLGVTELFSEGCGGGEEETVGIKVELHSEGLPEKTDTDATAEEIGDTSLDSDTTGEDANPDLKEHREASVTQEQVTYVLQKDLGVLSALPGETFTLLHLLTSDFVSWMGSASDMLLYIGETGFSNVYSCASSMLEALLSTCHTGVTGVGTLAGDTVGIFGDALDNAWWVTKFFGGRLWEQSEGYVGTVVSEMGGQAQAVGGGLGRLVWRSGNGVGNVLRMGVGVIMGMIDMVNGALREGFGQESE